MPFSLWGRCHNSIKFSIHPCKNNDQHISLAFLSNAICIFSSPMQQVSIQRRNDKCIWSLPITMWFYSIPLLYFFLKHYSDVIMSAMASQNTSLTIVYTTVDSGTDQGKHQSSASLAFVRRIHRWPVNSTHKGPVTRKMFPIKSEVSAFPIVVISFWGYVFEWLYHHTIRYLNRNLGFCSHY